MVKQYDHRKIEKKWQKVWEIKKTYKVLDPSTSSGRVKKKKFYSLIEFPYPSGDGLHVGHIRSNTAMDIISRKRRMEGYNVLYPIGWDAFGLPTENYAIKTGKKPSVVTKKNTDVFRKQLKEIGFSFDWSREINTTDPKYYKWTQWIFLQLFKNGLAYKAKSFINWCPSCKIGLANEEAVGGVCERCGNITEKREKEQWMLAITKYAERLDKDLDLVDYPERVKSQQRNWIGKSEGSEIEFKIKCNPSQTLPEGEGEMPKFFTTSPELWRALQDKVLDMRKNPTNGEKAMWDLLRRNNHSLDLPKGEVKNSKGFHFRRQHIIDRFIVDFVCIEKKLVIEVDGDIHDYKKLEDEERTGVLNQIGFEVIRFTNEEVIKNPKNVLEKIILKLNNVSSKALSFGEGLGGVDMEDLEGIKVFTTRPDTIFGVTYVVLAPEHDVITNLQLQIMNWEEVEDYIKKVKKETEQERTKEDKEKTGIELKGIKAINPANNEEISVWIADYVLPHYGTGAVMAVPQHDARDREFSEKYNLPIIDRPLVDAQEITKKVGGKIVTKFKLRDWVFSRQRYWGEPIPIINCEKCGFVPVKEKDLPIKLPEVKNYKPTDNGESPLASISKWVNIKCPKCKGLAKRETDTMPNWAGSSWYYLAYTTQGISNFQFLISNKNIKNKTRKNIDYWTPVDWYNGGMEHTTLHLLYSRFWHKFLYDLKLVPTAEPYKKRTSHGMILGEGGVKMSKSIGNVINPDSIVKTYGADTLRIYEMFMGPFEESVAWSTESIIGSRRFIEKVWRIGEKIITNYELRITNEKNKIKNSNNSFVRQDIAAEKSSDSQSFNISKILHKTIKKVSEDIENMRFNTAISSMMILATEMEKEQSRTLDLQKSPTLNLEDFKKFLQILSPFAPHVTEELYNQLPITNYELKNKKENNSSIHFSKWPKWDENLVKDQEIKIAVQINGKVRTEILIQTDENEEKVKKIALTNEVVLKYIQNEKPKRIIYVKNRVINILI